MCQEIPATSVMRFLNDLYMRLDSLLDLFGVYKVETVRRAGEQAMMDMGISNAAPPP